LEPGALQGEERREGAWNLGLAAAILFIVASHIRFVALDGRLPQDPNHAYHSLPAIFNCLGSWGDAWIALRAIFTETGGWYNFLLAASLRIWGRDPLVFQVFHVLWLAGVMVGLALVARRLWGPAAALVAVALIPPDGMGVVLLARIGWIHVPELALILLTLAALVHDPRLARGRTVVLAGLTGMAALALRPTALFWIATLAVVTLYGARQAARRTVELRRAGILLMSWGLGLIPLAGDLGDYLTDKLDARQRYEFLLSLRQLFEQVTGDLKTPIGLAILAGILAVLAPIPGRRGGGPRPGGRFSLLLLSWIVLPLILYIIFHAGVTNFPVYYAALALLAGHGFSRLPRALSLLPLLCWLPFVLAQWVPLPVAQAIYPHLPAAPPKLSQPGILNIYRPFRGLEQEDVLSLLRATCPAGEEPCRVLVDHSLFHPNGVEPGELELFLLGRDRVQVLEVREHGDGGPRELAHAYARFRCDPFDRDLRQRTPGLKQKMRVIARKGQYAQVWSRTVDRGCQYDWLTPGGLIRYPRQMPRRQIQGGAP